MKVAKETILVSFVLAIIVGLVGGFVWISVDSMRLRKEQCAEHGWVARAYGGSSSPPCVDSEGAGRWLVEETK